MYIAACNHMYTSRLSLPQSEDDHVNVDFCRCRCRKLLFVLRLSEVRSTAMTPKLTSGFEMVHVAD